MASEDAQMRSSPDELSQAGLSESIAPSDRTTLQQALAKRKTGPSSKASSRSSSRFSPTRIDKPPLPARGAIRPKLTFDTHSLPSSSKQPEMMEIINPSEEQPEQPIFPTPAKSTIERQEVEYSPLESGEKFFSTWDDMQEIKTMLGIAKQDAKNIAKRLNAFDKRLKEFQDDRRDLAKQVRDYVVEAQNDINQFVKTFHTDVDNYAKGVDERVERLQNTIGQAADYIRKLEGENFQVINQVKEHVTETNTLKEEIAVLKGTVNDNRDYLIKDGGNIAEI